LELLKEQIQQKKHEKEMNKTASSSLSGANSLQANTYKSNTNKLLMQTMKDNSNFSKNSNLAT
jgi:hypothetical protein